MTENYDDAPIVERIRAIDVPAPSHVHDSVAAMVQARERGGSRSKSPGGLRLRLGAAVATAGAAAVALVLALSGGGGAGLSLAQASAVTLRPSTMPAPRESGNDRDRLTAAVDGVSFPYWGERFGWRSAGSRKDRLEDRAVTTVFYRDGRGRTVGYAIVAGTAPSVDGGGQVRWRAGTAYRVGRVGGTEVVVWKRAGHLCVVSGRGVDAATLLTLASWDDDADSV